MTKLKTIAELPIVLLATIVLLIIFYFVLDALRLPHTLIQAVFTASAVFTGILVAYRGFELNSKAHQDPWFITFRDLHKEFWGEENLECVRVWICSDQEYEKTLLPVLIERKLGTVDAEKYEILEKLDKYCALMIRVCLIQEAEISDAQREIFMSLGYEAWIKKTLKRTEIYSYIKDHWEHLDKKIIDLKLLDSDKVDNHS